MIGNGDHPTIYPEGTRVRGNDSGVRTVTDATIIRNVLDGDRYAFRGLIQKYTGTVFGLIYHFTGRRDQMDDLSQEVFLQAYRCLTKLEKPECFGSWVYGITKRVCLNWLRRQKSIEVSLDDVMDDIEDPSAGTNPHLNAYSRGEESDVLRSVRSLPPIYRETLLLRYFENLSYREIARILNISASAVNVRLVKGRKILRERMARHARVQGVRDNEM